MKRGQSNTLSWDALSIYGVTILFYTIIYIVLILLPIYIHHQSVNFLAVGWIMGITMLVSMMCRPLAGRLIDRYGTGHVFITALIIFALSLLSYLSNSMALYWSARFIQGMVAACFSTAMEILVIHLLADKLRAQGLSLYSLATVIPTVFAPALTLFLLTQVSAAMLFKILVGLSLINLYCGWCLFRKVRKMSWTVAAPQKQTFRAFLSNPALIQPTVIMALASVGNGAVFTFLPLYLQQLGVKFASEYFFIQMLALVITRFIGAKYLQLQAEFPQRFVVFLLVGLLSGFVCITWQPTIIGLSLAAVMNGVGYALLYPTLTTLISFRIPSQQKGYFMGLFIGGADLGFALGALLIGLIAQFFSLKVAFGVCALLLFIAFLLIVLKVKNQ